MKVKLKDILLPQKKSKIKAGEGRKIGNFKFFTSSPLQTKYYDEFYYDEPALIFGTGGNASIHYCNEKFASSTDCLVMYGKDDINLEFVYYYLEYNIHLLQAGFKGAGLQHISKDYILDISMNLLDINRQMQAVEQIHKILNLIAKRKQQLLILDELVKSRFIEMFGESQTNSKSWGNVRLEEIANIGSSKRVFVNELKKEGIPFYRGTEVGALAEGHKIKPELYITKEHYKMLIEATGVPMKGDLLIPSICSDGRIWLVDTEEPFYFKDGRVLWIHPESNKINSCYLKYVLKDKIMKDYINIASGTTFAELKIFTLKSLHIILPPLNLQNQFATFVEQTSKSKLEIQKSLDKLEILKKSLMQQYFG